jgi:hypothetical protein
MAQSSMLSSHFTRRDHNGLPVVVRKRKGLLGFVGEERTAEQLVEVQNWNATHSTLCSVVESLGSVLDRIEFLENRVLHESIRANSPKAPACSMKAIASTNDLVEDEIARLEDRDVLARQRFEEILGITRLVVKYSLQDTPETLPDAIPPRESRTLIRMFTQSSHTSYSNSLGFCCSNWKLSKPVKGFPDLQKDNKLLRQGLQNHCEGNRAPSDWISLIDNKVGSLSNFQFSMNFSASGTRAT